LFAARVGLRFMLTAVYLVNFCALLACWPWWWRRAVSSLPLGQHTRCALSWVFWILTASMLCGAVASGTLVSDDLTSPQLAVLTILMVASIPQTTLFAAVLVPLMMRGKVKNRSFTHCLAVLECAIVIPTIVVVVGHFVAIRFLIAN
jgi:hypothetical protein